MLVNDGIVAGFDDRALDLATSIEQVDLQGATVLPGFCDSHVHLLSLVERAVGVDCEGSRSIGEIQARLRNYSEIRRAERGIGVSEENQERRTAEGRVPAESALHESLRSYRHFATPSWIRAQGYDDSLLSERRHPDRYDLDAAVPDQPVRLVHRTGHLAIVNSMALRLIPAATLERGREDGNLEISVDDGQPTGRLWDPGTWFSGSTLPPLAENEIAAGLAIVGQQLRSQGIVAVHDASVTNDSARFALWDRLARREQLPVRILMMVGSSHLPRAQHLIERSRWNSNDVTRANWPGLSESETSRLDLGVGARQLRTGPAKFVLPDDPSALPPVDDFAAGLAQASGKGWDLAIHAVIEPAIRLAVKAIGLLPRRTHARIEHAAELPLDLLDAVRASGASLVLHPGWIWERASRYLKTSDTTVLPWLHRGRSASQSGIPLLFGSDAPASRSDPFKMVSCAIRRRGAEGALLGPGEAMDARSALLALVAGRSALDRSAIGGAMRIGSLADFIIVDRDPLTECPERLSETRVLATFLAGRRAWQA